MPSASMSRWYIQTEFVKCAASVFIEQVVSDDDDDDDGGIDVAYNKRGSKRGNDRDMAVAHEERLERNDDIRLLGDDDGDDDDGSRKRKNPSYPTV